MLILAVSVRLSETDYRVNENEGPAQVCVVREGQTTQPISVTLISGELSPADAEGMCMYNTYVCMYGVLVGRYCTLAFLG